MKKMLFFAAIALASLGSCSSDEFVGEVQNPNTNSQENGAISFTSGSKAVTRALSNSESAALLNKNFVLFGTKTKETTTSTVFNNYQANYVTNTAYTTESNSNNWEYVSYNNVPGGVSNNTGVTAFANSNDNTGKVAQTIKYWDYATDQYDFAAYSLGKGDGTSPTYATASPISFSNLSTQAYTITGSAEELAACYISDLVTAYNKQAVAADNTDPEHPIAASPAANDYGKPVQFSFRSLGTKIRIAFYETIPGYSVKDVKFYNIALTNENLENPTTPTLTPTLFTSSAVLPSGNGTMKIKFITTGWSNRNETDYNKAHVTFVPASSSSAVSTMTFDELANYPTTYEGVLSSGNYIGRSSNNATYAGGLVDTNNDNTPDAGKYFTILPYEEGANLMLRIKYTLVSTDGSGETINVDNATAVVPAELAKWNPNYAYTYIFKISDMTNGSTGVDGNGEIVTGLTPITLDAVVVDSEDGVQETITTVSEPSITTYMAGKVITSNDEYIAGKDIYVIVNNGTSNVELEVGTNAKLFTATVESGAIQTISEASVDNAFAHGTYNSTAKTYTVTDAAGKKLTLTDTESTLLSAVTSIAATDSPTGNAITVNGAKFTPAAGTTYVFQYLVSNNAVNYTASEAATYNANLPGAISTSDVAYSFTSYGKQVDGENVTYTPEYGSGKVKEISKVGEWTTVLVISNSIEGFVGKEYKVHATTLDTNTFYELYSTAGAATGIYVKVESDAFTEEEVNTYNATLPGAVSTSTIKDSGKYGYKIIKIKE